MSRLIPSCSAFVCPFHPLQKYLRSVIATIRCHCGTTMRLSRRRLSNFIAYEHLRHSIQHLRVHRQPLISRHRLLSLLLPLAHTPIPHLVVTCTADQPRSTAEYMVTHHPPINTLLVCALDHSLHLHVLLQNHPISMPSLPPWTLLRLSCRPNPTGAHT
jgi:hypothetical protein